MTTSKRQRRLILTEEDYDDKLSAIVARDYFPDINRLEKKNELLDRRLDGDAVGAVAVRRATRLMIQDEEDATAQRERDDYDLVEVDHTCHPTAMTVRKDTSSTRGLMRIRKRPRPLEEESLTGFVARATNEDDEEFDSNMKRDVKEMRQQREELYGGSDDNNGKPIENANAHPSLEMASDDFLPESNKIEWKKPLARNGLFFNPTPIINPSLKENDDSKSIIDPKFMLIGDGELTTLMPPPTKQQTSLFLALRDDREQNSKLALKSQLIEYIPKHTLEKKIEPRATRFPSTNESSSGVANSNTTLRRGILDDDSDSNSDTGYMSSTTDASTDLDAPLRPINEERKCYQRKTKTKQYSFVRMTPQVIPSFSADSTHPAVSEETSKPSPQRSFGLPSPSEREDAVMKAERRMAQRVKLATSSSSRSSSKLRSKIRKRLKTETPQRLGSLTPAAMSLLEKTNSIRAKGQDTFGSALRTSYTPIIRHSSSSSARRSRGKQSKTRMKDHAYNATPQR